MIKIKLLFFSFLFLSSLICFSQIGININEPEATLDINGNLKIRTTSAAIASDDITSLVIDNITKEVKKSKKAINYTTYVLNNVNKDEVTNFNTNIKASDYNLVLLESSFDATLYPYDAGWFNPKNVYAYIEGGTWRIAAYFQGGSVYYKGNGNWTISCMILNKNISEKIPGITVDLDGLQTGSSRKPPELFRKGS
ncbi:hypothetical protein [Flavobacterium sp. CAU 1735]|uniref:hypothetical protein n=1 Tax=Flavobacterium sp. CAU 1735 TaxID=3140361 RepID=UPI00326019D9